MASSQESQATQKVQETVHVGQSIFISGLVYDNGKSGIAEYTNNITQSLCCNNKVTLALLQKDVDGFPIKNDNLTIIQIANLFGIPFFNILWHIIILPILVIIHSSDFLLLPAINRRMILWSSVPTAGVIHDLSQYAINNKYDPLRTFYVKKILPKMVSNIDIIIAVSQNTKNDVIQYWSIEGSKISVLYNGYDKERYNHHRPTNCQQVTTKYRLDKNYLLYVSRIEHPGKNHVNLIQAYEQLPAYITDKFDLVFAGSDWSGAEVVKDAISHSKLNTKIKTLGYVPSSDLPALYHCASASVFPSLYEGFGIPLIEAMACGLPTTCSNNSSLFEVSGNASLSFDPTSVNDIAKQIKRITTQKGLSERLIEKGLERCQDFNWDTLGPNILSLLRATQTQAEHPGHTSQPNQSSHLNRL